MSLMTIADKDGGIVTELRSQIGVIPVYLPGTGDGQGRKYWSKQISVTGSGDSTIHTPDTGKRFNVDTLVITVQHAGSALRFKSGASQNLSGVIRLPANTPFGITHGENAGLQGKSIDDALILNASGDYLTPYVGGWVTGYDESA